jgi:hypothetical protein
MRARTSASQACGSMSFNLAVTIRLNIAAARCPPYATQICRPRALCRQERASSPYSTTASLSGALDMPAPALGFLQSCSRISSVQADQQIGRAVDIDIGDYAASARPNVRALPGSAGTSATMPATPVAAGVTVLPPALVPAAPAPSPRMPCVGIPAISPPKADTGRYINANGRSRRLAPITLSRAAPVGACRQGKSEAERQDNCREKHFHAGANADRGEVSPLA